MLVSLLFSGVVGREAVATDVPTSRSVRTWNRMDGQTLEWLEASPHGARKANRNQIHTGETKNINGDNLNALGWIGCQIRTRAFELFIHLCIYLHICTLLIIIKLFRCERKIIWHKLTLSWYYLYTFRRRINLVLLSRTFYQISRNTLMT